MLAGDWTGLCQVVAVVDVELRQGEHQAGGGVQHAPYNTMEMEMEGMVLNTKEKHNYSSKTTQNILQSAFCKVTSSQM